MEKDNLSDDCFEEKLIHEKYVDPDEKIEFKEITIRITKAKFEEWSDFANHNEKSLDEYIKSSVENHLIREMIINYLQRQASTKPWWEKKSYNL